jgi:Na+-transporting NADH:ubiquinone oxidoreductase subunit C
MAADHDWVRLIAAPALVLAAAAPGYAVQYLTVEQAQRVMFGAGARFERRDLVLSREVAREIEQASGVKVRLLQQPWWEVSENGSPAGHFIIDEVVGKHEFITYAVALEPDARVRGIEILDYRETYGYQIRSPVWRAQFVGKTSVDPLALDTDIKNISGATLSCRHITEGVRRLLIAHRHVLNKP